MSRELECPSTCHHHVDLLSSLVQDLLLSMSVVQEQAQRSEVAHSNAECDEQHGLAKP